MNANLDAARAAFARKSPDELADTLRTMAADARLDSMPSKFRLAMEAAADRMEPAQPAGWQPIETAPKDGTSVLVGWWSAGVWIVRNAWWEDGFDINIGAIDPAGEGWWYPNTSIGTYKVCRENNAVDGPQYWMPMPKEPPEFS